MSEPMEAYRQASLALDYLQKREHFYDYKKVIQSAPPDVQDLLDIMSKNLYVPFYSPEMVWGDVKDILQKAVSKKDSFQRKQDLHDAEKEGMYALLNKVLEFTKD